MIKIPTRKAIELLLCALFCLCVCPTAGFAAVDSLGVDKVGELTETEFRTPFADRIAVRTNALDWLLTIPNIGFDIDLTGSEYNAMTIGVSAKYNWNTTHTYAPPVVFNLMDIRPEFRYWYRTRRPDGDGGKKLDLEHMLKDRKNPKTWRAHYVGAYVNYSTYAFKFSKTGMQGKAIGIGASAGYNIPMYEYRNGSVDVELGFSVGLQICSKELFAHNPNGFTYTGIKDGSRTNLGFTPFPVVSDLRVAFVWRHKSIKDKIKEDEDRNRLEGLYKAAVEKDIKFDIDDELKNTRDSLDIIKIKQDTARYKAVFDEYMAYQEDRLRTVILPGVFYGEEDSGPRVQAMIQEYLEKLDKLIDRRKESALRRFDREYNALNRASANAGKKEETPKDKKEKPEKEEKRKEKKARKNGENNEVEE